MTVTNEYLLQIWTRTFVSALSGCADANGVTARGAVVKAKDIADLAAEAYLEKSHELLGQ